MENQKRKKVVGEKKKKKKKKRAQRRKKEYQSVKKERVPICQEKKEDFPCEATGTGGAPCWRPDFEQRSRRQNKIYHT